MDDAMMKCSFLLSLILMLPFASTHAQGAAPEIVQGSEVTVDGEVKCVTMESEAGRYVLFCNLKAAGCITPAPQERYYLFNKNTQWQMPGAKNVIDLKFLQGWMVKYPNAENIGLVLVNTGPSPQTEPFGMFALLSWSKR